MPSDKRVRGREAAQAEQCAGDGDALRLGEGEHLGLGAATVVGLGDAVAGEDDRLLRARGSVRRRPRSWSRWRVSIGCGRKGSGAAAAKSKAAAACCASLVMSTSTGPGRPESAIWKALRTVGAMSSARVTRKLCLVMGSVMPVMSTS